MHPCAARVHKAELCAAFFQSLLARFFDIGENLSTLLVRAGAVDYDVDVRGFDELDVGVRVLDGAEDGDDFETGELVGFGWGAGQAVDFVVGADEGGG